MSWRMSLPHEDEFQRCSEAYLETSLQNPDIKIWRFYSLTEVPVTIIFLTLFSWALDNTVETSLNCELVRFTPISIIV